MYCTFVKALAAFSAQRRGNPRNTNGRLLTSGQCKAESPLSSVDQRIHGFAGQRRTFSIASTAGDRFVRHLTRSLNNLWGSLDFNMKSKRARKARARRKARAIRPQFDALEPRQLMAGDFYITSATALESDGSATALVTVHREPGGSGSASVDFRTINGSALAGSDYAETLGTLTFTSSEIAKTLSVPILPGSVQAAEALDSVLGRQRIPRLGSRPTRLQPER